MHVDALGVRQIIIEPLCVYKHMCRHAPHISHTLSPSRTGAETQTYKTMRANSGRNNKRGRSLNPECFLFRAGGAARDG